MTNITNSLQLHIDFAYYNKMLPNNPIVGYSKLKDCVRMMFWSGQSFDELMLKPEGTFKAAEFRFTRVDEINLEDVKRCLLKAREIQWDYKKIVVLERLK